MEGWEEPIEMEPTGDDGNPAFMTKEKWWPVNATNVRTPNSSVDDEIIMHVIMHVNNNTRKFVDQDAPMVLVLDGGNSRSGYRGLN